MCGEVCTTELLDYSHRHADPKHSDANYPRTVWSSRQPEQHNRCHPKTTGCVTCRKTFASRNRGGNQVKQAKVWFSAPEHSKVPRAMHSAILFKETYRSRYQDSAHCYRPDTPPGFACPYRGRPEQVINRRYNEYYSCRYYDDFCVSMKKLVGEPGVAQRKLTPSRVEAQLGDGNINVGELTQPQEAGAGQCHHCRNAKGTSTLHRRTPKKYLELACRLPYGPAASPGWSEKHYRARVLGRGARLGRVYRAGRVAEIPQTAK